VTYKANHVSFLRRTAVGTYRSPILLDCHISQNRTRNLVHCRSDTVTDWLLVGSA